MIRKPSCSGSSALRFSSRRHARLGALALAVPAALAVAVSSCSTVPARAATVNGTTISRSDFERDLEALAANPGLLNLTGGTDVSIDGPTARSWLSQVILSLIHI